MKIQNFTKNICQNIPTYKMYKNAKDSTSSRWLSTTAQAISTLGHGNPQKRPATTSFMGGSSSRLRSRISSCTLCPIWETSSRWCSWANLRADMGLGSTATWWPLGSTRRCLILMCAALLMLVTSIHPIWAALKTAMSWLLCLNLHHSIIVKETLRASPEPGAQTILSLSACPSWLHTTR